MSVHGFLQQEKSLSTILSKLVLLFSLCVTLLSSNQVSADDIVVTASSTQQPLGIHVEYYEDASELLTIEDVIATNFDVNFLPNNRDTLHFGITSSAYWLRFSLDWSQIDDDIERLIEFGPPKHVPGVIRGGIEVYFVDSRRNILRQVILGSNQASSGEIETLNRGFALRVTPDFEGTLFARVTSARPLRLPLSLWQEGEFRKAEMNANAGLGLQYGILLAMIFYNLFLYLSIRESSFLFYVISVSSQISFIFFDSKHFRFLLGSNTIDSWGVDLAERMVYPLLVITILLFQRSLLRLKVENNRLDKLVLSLIAAYGLVVLATLLPSEKPFQYLYVGLILLSIPIAAYTNIDAIRRGNSAAVMHMVALGFFLFCTVIHIAMQLLPIVPSNSITTNIFPFGLVAQAVLMSFGLAFRYNQVKQEKEDAQQLAINNLIRSEQVKDDLLTNVTHELRTPLFGINGLAETALIELRGRGNDLSVVEKNLTLIQTSGDRLSKLVNDLLDFSKSTDDTDYVKFRPVDLHSLATLVIAICRPLIGNKNITLKTDIDENLPLVAGDEDRLQQVLVNLTSNAIKFTYSGEVVINAELASDYSILVSVRDTGIGIHKTDHETIFKTFEKIPSQNSQHAGIGLGLPLAKRIVEMHKSKLMLESELDIGSTFSFNLRVSIDQTRAVKTSGVENRMIRRSDYMESATATPNLPQLKSEEDITILVVDDDEINRVVMGQQLEEYNVIKCSNGLDALTSVEESKPDLVLLDLMMPGLNGYEVCQKLRQQYNQIELPIILVTAKNHLEDLTLGFQTGANDYLPKPFHNEELKSRVENQLRLSMLHRVHEDNIVLRAQIETYVEADIELRSSRFKLEQVLNSIEAGFLAFELPGKIFSLNQRAADLLGSTRELLEGQDILSILTEDECNLAFRNYLMRWENEELDSSIALTSDLEGDLKSEPQTELAEQSRERDSSSEVISLFEIEVIYPFSQTAKSATKTTRFTSRLKLFATEEGTGILFLDSNESSLASSTSAAASSEAEKIISDTVELVSFLGQAQQNIRRIGTRLSVMTPEEVSDYPALIEKLWGIEDLVDYIDNQLPSVSSEGEYRQQLVTLMRSALHTWEVTTQKSKIELAEESNIWAVSIDDGRLRTRTFDRYLRLEQLPKIPRWREVVRTAYFVLSNPSIEPETRASLEAELEKTKSILKKAAVS